MNDYIDKQNILHRTNVNVEKAEKLYSEKDGCEVKYVCTSALTGEGYNSLVPMDIFYREEPHPEFGNKYFALFYHPLKGDLRIMGADPIEGEHINMIERDEGGYIYSQHRHDYVTTKQAMLDGGRSYHKGYGHYITFIVTKGELKKVIFQKAKELLKVKKVK